MQGRSYCLCALSNPEGNDKLQGMQCRKEDIEMFDSPEGSNKLRVHKDLSLPSNRSVVDITKQILLGPSWTQTKNNI